MGLQKRFEGMDGTFWQTEGELAKGVGHGDNSLHSSRVLRDGRPRPDAEHPWFMHRYVEGGDYGGSLVERSNYEVLLEAANQLAEALGDDSWFQALHGSHGSYGILFHVIRTPDEIVEELERLNDYPLLDEQHNSELEMEAQDEAWKNWAERDYRRALEKKFGGDADEVTDDALFQHFHDWADQANVYWVNEQGDSMYIDIDRIVKRADDPPDGFIYEDDEVG